MKPGLGYTKFRCQKARTGHNSKLNCQIDMTVSKLCSELAHSVAANPLNNHIFVPIEYPNLLCGPLPGCGSIFTDFSIPVTTV